MLPTSAGVPPPYQNLFARDGHLAAFILTKITYLLGEISGQYIVKMFQVFVRPVHTCSVAGYVFERIAM